MAEKIIQFIGTTPEKAHEPLVELFKKGFSELQQHFQPKIPTEYLTRNETAKLLSVDLSTLHNWVKAGKLKAYGIGSRVYFKRTEVEAAIKPLR